MKKIIPFKKEIVFKTNLAEVTSISLEHSLHVENDQLITGSFEVSGEYKISDNSATTDIFSFELPFDIEMDERYDLSSCSVDIHDFYYEIINNSILAVNIEVSVSNFKEKPLIEEEEEEELQEVTRTITPLEADLVREETEPTSEGSEKIEEPEEIFNKGRCVEEETPEDLPKERIGTLFDSFDETKETYATYKVYIVREGDTLESILEKYSTTKEILEPYNQLSELQLGMKLIIPQTEHATDI